MSGIISDNQGRSSGLVKSAGGGGTILKVKSVKFTGTASETGEAPSQLSDFDMSFAPTTSDGKLYFEAHVVCGTGGTTSVGLYFYDVTNTTIIGAYADAAGSRLRLSWRTANHADAAAVTASFGTWHEPGSTDSRDYTIFGNANYDTTLYINRALGNDDNASINNSNTASTFTITEYAASAVTLT